MLIRDSLNQFQSIKPVCEKQIRRYMESPQTFQDTNLVNIRITSLFVLRFYGPRPSEPNGVMSRAVSLPNHTFYWAGLVC